MASQQQYTQVCTENNFVSLSVRQYLSQLVWVVSQISYSIKTVDGTNRVGGSCTLNYNGAVVDTNPNGSMGAFGGNPPIKLYNGDALSLYNTAALIGDTLEALIIYQEMPAAFLPSNIGGQMPPGIQNPSL